MARVMKDSGIEWIGEIPEEWEVIKLRKLGLFTASGIDKIINPDEPLVRIINYTDVYRNETLELKDKEYMIVSAPEQKIKEHCVKEGDLIFTPSSETIEDIGVSALVTEHLVNTAFSYHVLRFQFNREVVKLYKKYLCNNYYLQNYFSRQATGSIRKTLNRNDFKEALVILPPLPSQQRIASYLDKKCEEIDSIIENTKATIEEYKKYKYAVIADTVTTGLYTNVKSKNSGIDWIGSLPVNWNIIKLKYLFSIKKEIANKLGYDILSVTQNGLKIKDISNNEGQISSDYSKYQIVEPNDFVMNHMDLLTGWVDCSVFYGVTSPDYRVFSLNDESKALREYFKYIFQLCYKHRIFYGLGQGVSNMGRWRLQTDKFINFQVSLPPIEEQKEIVEFLNIKCLEIDTLISKKQQLLTELESYKKSLIYECVTGKVEV